MRKRIRITESSENEVRYEIRRQQRMDGYSMEVVDESGYVEKRFIPLAGLKRLERDGYAYCLVYSDFLC